MVSFTRQYQEFSVLFVRPKGHDSQSCWRDWYAIVLGFSSKPNRSCYLGLDREYWSYYRMSQKNMSISQSILLQSQQNWTFFILPLHIPHSYDVLKYLLTTTKQLASHTSIQFCTYIYSIKTNLSNISTRYEQETTLTFFGTLYLVLPSSAPAPAKLS